MLAIDRERDASIDGFHRPQDVAGWVTFDREREVRACDTAVCLHDNRTHAGHAVEFKRRGGRFRGFKRERGAESVHGGRRKCLSLFKSVEHGRIMTARRRSCGYLARAAGSPRAFACCDRILR